MFMPHSNMPLKVRAIFKISYCMHDAVLTICCDESLCYLFFGAYIPTKEKQIKYVTAKCIISVTIVEKYRKL